jgi:hypothetical protein
MRKNESIYEPNKALRLRDFIKARGYFFSVVGYDHKEGVKSFLRYVPSTDGERISRDGKRYRKLLHKEAIDFSLTKNLKYYRKDKGVFIVPVEDIEEIFKPEERISTIEDREVRKVVEFFSGIPESKMGVTGSRLIGLEMNDSDIDFIMYGKFWFEGQKRIKKGIESGKVSEPTENTWNFIYAKRKVNVPFDIFLAHERRKYHRAMLGSTYFDLLYVRDYEELKKPIPEEKGKKMAKMIVRARLKNNSLTFDYPAYYPIEHSEVKAILCFTHTYVGQALVGEVIEARGDVEIIDGEKYLIVGTSREVEDEYIVSLDFLEKTGLMDEFESWKKDQRQIY